MNIRTALSAAPTWSYIGITIVLTVYGQLVLKWQVGQAGSLPAGSGAKVEFVLRLLLNPWMVTVGLSVLVAALAWMAVMTAYDLSEAYPFMAMTFVGVLVFSALLLGEPMTMGKVLGVAFIVIGLVIGSRF